MRVAIIPVRGGSSGVIRKNMRPLAGKPLLWYITQAAKSSTFLDKIVISTEDEEILKYAQSLNVDVFNHPKHLSSDSSPSLGVIQWVLNEIIIKEIYPEVCILLRATSPFCLFSDIDAAISMFSSIENCDSVVSVTKSIGVHPIKLKSINTQGKLINKYGSEDGIPIRRQELEDLYIRNAAIYVSKPEIIFNGKLWGDNCYGYIMPEERSININTEFQFKLAKLYMEYKQQNS